LSAAARELSDDPSAADGGDLGFVTAREFASWAGTTALDRVQRLALGELSGPLLLEVYHEEQLASVPEGHLLVRVEARETRHPRQFEEARADVLASAATERAREARRVIRKQVLDEIHAEVYVEGLRTTSSVPGYRLPVRQ
jgi:hypothetical protein